MDLLQFMKNEGYTSAKFSSLTGEDVQLVLNDVASTEDLYRLMDVTPTSVTYYPYERVPYIDCFIDQNVMKLRLSKA
ncbi:hypothetical protein [Halobacillus sp. Nhm2S1]|uniref:hypothetical protein n=1 Tax=Halobacillus sp. Nhm2S1 TaxID=2866716 RepID=UPI001C72BF3A|nr:hypothetical protein [Halobacillus sp. Nhm2S1]MBX0358381.1 hypothetical protein [Halobacillus sp. Nhm2S1]